MENSIEEKLFKVVEALSEKVLSDNNSDNIIKFTQAALNVANIIAIIKIHKMK